MKPLSDGSDSAYNNHELDRFLDEMSTQDASSMQFEIDKINFDLFGDPLSSNGASSSASPFPVDEEMFAEEYNPFGSSDPLVHGDSDLEMAADSHISDDQRQAPYAFNDLLSVPSLLDPDYSTVDIIQPDTEPDDLTLDLEQPVIDFEDLDEGIEAHLDALNAEADLEDLDTEVETNLEDLNAAVEAHLDVLNAEADLEDLDTEVEPDMINLQRLAAAFDRMDLENLPGYMDEIDLESSALDFNPMVLDNSAGDYYEIDLESLAQDPAEAPTSFFPLEADHPGVAYPVPGSLVSVQDPTTDLSTTFRLSHPTHGPLISMRRQSQSFSPRMRLLLLLVVVLLLAGGTGLLTLHMFSPAQPIAHNTKVPKLVVDARPVPASSLNVVVGSIPTVTPTSTPTPVPTPTPEPTIIVTPPIQPTHAFSPPPVAPPAPKPAPTPTPRPKPTPTPTPVPPPAVVNYISNPTFQNFTDWQCSSNAVIANNTLRIIPDSTQGGVCWQTINNLQPNHNYVYQVYLKGSNPGIYVAGWNHWLASSNVANYQVLSVTFSTGTATSEAINIYANQGQAEVDAQNASMTLAP